MHLSKNLKKAIKPFLDKGWYLSRIGKHYIFKHNLGGTVAVSRTSSDRLFLQRVVRDFERESMTHNH